MYATLIMVTCLVLYKTHLNEGRMIGRFRRDTNQPHVEAIYSRYKQQSHGEATYYGNYPGGGACSLDPLSPLASQPGWIRVAAGYEDFQNSLGCGMCLEITGTGKGKGSNPVTGTLRGIVHDLCGGCKQGDLDLYIPGDGRWEISFKAIDCPTLSGSDGNIMMKFTGSNPWYIKLQARNTRVPVAGIEVLKNGKYSCLRRVNDNYFVGDKLGKVDFPMQVRLTAVNGEQRETIISGMKNDQDTLTDIQFTGHETGGGPSTIKCVGQGNKPPYPPGGMDPGSPGVSPGQPTTGTTPGPVPAPAPAPAPPTYPPSPENVNFCKGRKGGTYTDPDRCSGFIICNIGNTHRMTCGDGLMFNTNGMNCDLPERVDCGDRPLDRPKGNNHDDIQGQFSHHVLQSEGHRQSLKMEADQPIGIHKGPSERKSNESLPLEVTHSERETNVHEKPALRFEQDSNTDKQPLKAGTTSLPGRHEFEDKMKPEETPSIQLGFDFGENKKEEKTDDSTQTDSKHVKTNNPPEPVVHVLINGNKNLSPTSSSSKSDDEASKSKPSFQIMVNNDGVKASLGRSEGEHEKIDDTSRAELDVKKPKHTFSLVINNDQRKKVNDETEGNNGAVREQERVGGEDEHRNSKPNFELTINNNKDQVIEQNDQRQKEFENQSNNNDHPAQDNSKQGQNMADGSRNKNQELDLNNQHLKEVEKIGEAVKAQHMNAANKEKEPGLDIELLPLLPLHDQPFSSNASPNTKIMNAKNNSNDIIVKTPVTQTTGTSMVIAQGDSNAGKQGTQNTQNNTRTNNLEKVGIITKIQDKGSTLVGPRVAQQTPLLNPTKAENNTRKLSEPLPITSTNTVLLASHQQGLKFRLPQITFKHPLEALGYGNQQQPLTIKERLREENGKNTKAVDSPKQEDSSQSLENKINGQRTEKESDKPGGAIGDSHGTSPQNLEGQGKVKRPTVDILVNGGSGGTTELRMRNSNNEIARLNDASGKPASNRNPVIGITIRQKGSPDHHILFSKRQRLSNGKHHHHHHKHH